MQHSVSRRERSHWTRSKMRSITYCAQTGFSPYRSALDSTLDGSTSSVWAHPWGAK